MRLRPVKYPRWLTGLGVVAAGVTLALAGGGIAFQLEV